MLISMLLTSRGRGLPLLYFLAFFFFGVPVFLAFGRWLLLLTLSTFTFRPAPRSAETLVDRSFAAMLDLDRRYFGSR